MPIRRTYWAIGLVFFMLLVFSHRRGNFTNDDGGDISNIPAGRTQQQQKPPPGSGGGRGDTFKKHPPGPPVMEKPYTRDPAVLDNSNNNPSTQSFKPLTIPNISNQYDSLIIIPTSWTQLQNRVWVRETLFGIKNNLEPCARYDGNIIYKFYIYGKSTWDKQGIYTAQYMQAQVRNLHGEFMEFDDWHFTNRTVVERHDIWGDALDWAVNTFIPQEKVKVDKVIIFDSTSIVNIQKLESIAKQIPEVGTAGLLHTWGETPTTPYAALISFSAAQQILKSRAIIEENRVFMDLITAATLYYNSQLVETIKVAQGEGPLWQGDIDQIKATTAVVGMVHQLEDWIPLTQRLAVQPISPCAVDPNRRKNIAVLTSSYIYADMCMAEAALPSADNKRIYAEKHGYYFVARAAEFIQEEFRHRQRVWGKIGAIQKVLPHYEWILWMDMDAIVANLDRDAREIILQAEQLNKDKANEVSVIVARPSEDHMLNAGVMLIKNTDWGRRFLMEVQRRKTWYNRRPSYEQGAIWDVIRDPLWSSGVYLFDRDDHTMNTFPDFYEQGDFIVHFAPAGCPSVPVLQALRNIQSGDSIVGVGLKEKKVVAKAKAAAAA
ncbi:MAG: galactosyl transferase GMA12/MNN10 family-domain-containing protein [Linnemannia gamsii]|nr:MAG: galactosyl transferase GMA12/MNN10 family-domain-containing protein [Linnemannia gamsii]